MKAEEILNKIAAFFNNEEKEEVTLKLSQVIQEVSKYDITIDQDTLEVGTEITQSFTSEDGETDIWRLTDGEYELEDGRKIQVDADGKIVLISGDTAVEETEEEMKVAEEAKLAKEAEVKLAEEEAAKLAEEDEEDPIEEKTDAEIIADLEMKVEELTTENAELKAKIAELEGTEEEAAKKEEEMKKVNAELTKQVEELKEEPASKPVSLSGTKNGKLNFSEQMIENMRSQRESNGKAY